MGEKRIILEEIGKTFLSSGGAINAIENISFDVKAHEIVSIIGPSGCGKTTLLRIMAGLVKPSCGTVKFEPPSRNPMIIFQQYESCLLPNANIEKNIGISLLNHSISKAQKQERIKTALRKTKLEGIERLYPWELSGGMQQRVLLARALASEPPCLLLDEPFASVDAQTRYELEDAIRDMSLRLDAAMVYVTHDLDSALYCGDRVIILSQRPAKVIKEIKVCLGQQRTQNQTRSSSIFGELRAQIYETLTPNSR